MCYWSYPLYVGDLVKVIIKGKHRDFICEGVVQEPQYRFSPPQPGEPFRDEHWKYRVKTKIGDVMLPYHHYLPMGHRLQYDGILEKIPHFRENTHETEDWD